MTRLPPAASRNPAAHPARGSTDVAVPHSAAAPDRKGGTPLLSGKKGRTPSLPGETRERCMALRQLRAKLEEAQAR